MSNFLKIREDFKKDRDNFRRNASNVSGNFIPVLPRQSDVKLSNEMLFHCAQITSTIFMAINFSLSEEI